MQLNFNAQNVAPQESNFEPIPNAWYLGTVEKAELKPTKAGTGSYISLMMNVQGPTHANRKIFGNLNVTNPNAQAQEIGQAQLSAMCHAIGVMNLTDVNQLVGIPLEFRTKIAAATYNVKGDASSGVLYEARNEIAGFRAAGGATAVGATGSASAPSKPAGPSKPVSSPAAQAAQPEVSAQAEASAPQEAPQEAQGQAATVSPDKPW